MISKTNMNFKYLDIKHGVNQATGIVCSFIGCHFSIFAQSCNGPDRLRLQVWSTSSDRWMLTRQHRLWAAAFHHPVRGHQRWIFRAAEATLFWADAAGGVPRWSVRRPLSPVCLPTAVQAVRQTEHCAASKCCMRAAF